MPYWYTGGGRFPDLSQVHASTDLIFIWIGVLTAFSDPERHRRLVLCGWSPGRCACWSSALQLSCAPVPKDSAVRTVRRAGFGVWWWWGTSGVRLQQGFRAARRPAQHSGYCPAQRLLPSTAATCLVFLSLNLELEETLMMRCLRALRAVEAPP